MPRQTVKKAPASATRRKRVKQQDRADSDHEEEDNKKRPRSSTEERKTQSNVRLDFGGRHFFRTDVVDLLCTVCSTNYDTNDDLIDYPDRVEALRKMDTLHTYKSLRESIHGKPICHHCFVKHPQVYPRDKNDQPWPSVVCIHLAEMEYDRKLFPSKY